MVLSSDHISPATGLTPTVTISKNGNSFTSPSGAVTEIGSGWYAIAGNATDRNTLGDFIIHATGTGADPVDDRYLIVPYNPFDSVRLGLTSLPDASADAAGGLPISDAGGLDIDTLLGRLDAAISTRSTLTAQQVWEYATRTLSSFGTLIADLWSYATRALTDKAGFTISGTKTTLDSLNDVSAATVRTQIDNGLAAYDPPTKTEMDNAISPLALQSTLTTVAGYVDTEVAAIKLVTDKLDTAMEIDGSVYQFTTNALEHAPSSSGGDATAANQTIIINHLTDVKGATFSGTTDSLEAIRDRGDAAWVTGSGLSGSNTVLLTVQDGSLHNIIGAFVDIFDSANSTFLQRSISNSSGQVSFSMDDGTYYVRIVKSGYSFTAVQMVISGNYTHTYNMTVYTISSPALPTLCRVYTYIFKPDGTYHTTLSGVATVGVYTEDNQYYTYESTAVYDNTTGLIYWDIVQGASASLTITELKYFGKTITVPALATSELNDL